MSKIEFLTRRCNDWRRLVCNHMLDTACLGIVHSPHRRLSEGNDLCFFCFFNPETDVSPMVQPPHWINHGLWIVWFSLAWISSMRIRMAATPH